jgi:hypothetical protein
MILAAGRNRREQAFFRRVASGLGYARREHAKRARAQCRAGDRTTAPDRRALRPPHPAVVPSAAGPKRPKVAGTRRTGHRSRFRRPSGEGAPPARHHGHRARHRTRDGTRGRVAPLRDLAARPDRARRGRPHVPRRSRPRQRGRPAPTVRKMCPSIRTSSDPGPPATSESYVTPPGSDDAGAKAPVDATPQPDLRPTARGDHEAPHGRERAARIHGRRSAGGQTGSGRRRERAQPHLDRRASSGGRTTRAHCSIVALRTFA